MPHATTGTGAGTGTGGYVPAVDCVHSAKAAGAAAGGAGGPGGAGGVQVQTLRDITPTRGRSLREQRRSVTAQLHRNLLMVLLVPVHNKQPTYVST